MSLVYLAALLVSIGSMVLLDRRFRLFFWRDSRRATIVLTVVVLFFVVWDLLGIALGIFFRGESSISTGALLAPDMPIEEPIFLVFLCYLTMVLITGVELMIRSGRGQRS